MAEYSGGFSTAIAYFREISQEKREYFVAFWGQLLYSSNVKKKLN